MKNHFRLFRETSLRLLLGTFVFSVLGLTKSAYSMENSSEATTITEERTVPRKVEMEGEVATPPQLGHFLFLRNNWVLTDLPSQQTGSILSNRKVISRVPFPIQGSNLALLKLEGPAPVVKTVLIYNKGMLPLKNLGSMNYTLHNRGNFIVIGDPSGTEYLYGFKNWRKGAPDNQFSRFIVAWINKTIDTQ